MISGTFNMGTGDKLDTKATRALGPGSVAIMQPGTRHFAWTKEETVVQVHGVGPWTVTLRESGGRPTQEVVAMGAPGGRAFRPPGAPGRIL